MSFIKASLALHTLSYTLLHVPSLRLFFALLSKKIVIMSGTHHADKGKGLSTAPKSTKQRRVTIEIDLGPTLSSYDGDANAIAKMMWEEAHSAKVRNVRRDLTRALLAERRPDEPSGPVRLQAVTTSRQGHLGFVASEITVDNAESLAHGELLCWKMLEAIPQGCLILDPRWTTRIAEQPRKLAYISKHLHAIENDAKSYVDSRGTLAGCGAKLGKHSIVYIRSVDSYVDNGTIHCSMTIGADKTHPLVGINCWNFAYDPSRPNKIFFHNWLIGKNRVPKMDQVNNAVGSGLMSTIYRTIPYAIKAGEDLDTFLKSNCKQLYDKRARYRALDNLSWLPIGVKRVVGQDFAAESSQINTLEGYDGNIEMSGLSGR